MTENYPVIEPLEYIQTETGPEPTHSIIWLHGLGADGNDFVNLPEMLSFGKERVRFIFPHAPTRPITINGGMTMRGWYDLQEMPNHGNEDLEGLKESSDLVIQLLEQEIMRGVTSTKIFLGGFSQGGALSLYLGLRYKQPLAGIVALSSYLPTPNLTATETSDANRKTEIFMGHGLNDPIVPIELADISHKTLKGLEYPVVWRTYSMEHSICEAEMRDLRQYFVQSF